METLPQVAPQSAYTPREDPIFGQYWAPANQWLRMILGLLQGWECLRSCIGANYSTEEFTLTETLQTLRDADPLSVSVTVYNSGKRPAWVYEGGVLVLYLPASAEKQLAVSGLLEIAAVGAGDGAWVQQPDTLSWVYNGGEDTTGIAFDTPVDFTAGETVRVGTEGAYTEHEIVEVLSEQTIQVAGEVTGPQQQEFRLLAYALVTAHTVRRCLCGDAPAYYNSGPVGSFLL